MKIDSDSGRKLTFKKQGSRAEIYSERNDAAKRTFTKEPSRESTPGNLAAKANGNTKANLA
jgi:hypothetical protein